MALAFAYGHATNYEEIQILKAAFGMSPDIPAHYYAGISTTTPTETGTITEFSGSGYARVQIPSWTTGAGAYVDSGAPWDLPLGISDSANYIYNVPGSGGVVQDNILFPNPTATWWADGTTVYLFLADAASGGNVRWWYSMTPVHGPSPAHPLRISVIDPFDFTPAVAIGVELQYSAGNVGNYPTVAPDMLYGALNALTGAASYTPPAAYYAGVDNDAPSQGGTYEPLGLNVPFSGDGTYARQSVSWSTPATGGDGRAFLQNSANIVWTVGGTTAADMNRSMQWTTASTNHNTGSGNYFIIWDSATADKNTFGLPSPYFWGTGHVVVPLFSSGVTGGGGSGAGGEFAVGDTITLPTGAIKVRVQ